MQKLKIVLRWIGAHLSIAHIIFFMAFAGLIAAITMSIAAQQIDEEYRLQPPPESNFKPVLPKGYKPDNAQ